MEYLVGHPAHLLGLTGEHVQPAIALLVVYALPSIVRNTAATLLQRAAGHVSPPGPVGIRIVSVTSIARRAYPLDTLDSLGDAA